MGTVRSLVWILPVGFSLSVAAAQPLSPPKYRVFQPGPVTPSGSDQFSLTGSFTVSPDPIIAALQDASHGSGGACIFADLAKHGAPEVACTSSSQCHSAWASYHQANLSNPNYDAAAFGTVGNGFCVANRCLYRPAPAVAACARRPFPNVWGIGHHEFGPFAFQHVAQMYGNDAEIDWQIVTCANRAQPNGTDDTSCLQGAGIYKPDADASTQSHATDWDSIARSAPEQ